MFITNLLLIAIAVAAWLIWYELYCVRRSRIEEIDNALKREHWEESWRKFTEERDKIENVESNLN